MRKALHLQWVPKNITENKTTSIPVTKSIENLGIILIKEWVSVTWINFFLIHSLNFIKRQQKNEVQWLRIHLPMQQIQTQSLVEELRSTCHGATNPSTATSEPTSSGTHLSQLQRSLCTAMKDPACHN